jgi:4-O-beta-D-mannosyl-D-glucose phosphorylase
MTDLSDPTRLTYMPGGYVLAPRGRERIGDVSNVLFANGVTVNEKREVFLYYASSDTRMHVATSTVDRLIDYCINTPQVVYRSTDSVNQRLELIRKNQEFMKDRRK